MGPEVLAPLLAAYRRFNGGALMLCVANLVAQIRCFLVFLTLDHKIKPGLIYFVGALTMVFFCAVLYPVYWLFAMIRSQRAIAHVIATFEDVRAIPPIVDLMADAGKRRRSMLSAQLQQLLPLAQTADAAVLQQISCAGLNRLLESGWGQNQPISSENADLTVAILEAYPYIGDAQALVQVRALARFAAEPMRTAAKECLPQLQARLEAEKERRTLEKVGEDLLRASSNEGVATELLLRAATGADAIATSQQPQQLLRPVDIDA